MNISAFTLIIGLFSGFWLPLAHAQTAPPHVVVSITPFHALVAGVTCGVVDPKLLVPPGASPHHYTLRPSEVEMLHQADIVFWGGPDLESFLDKSLSTLSHAKVIRLDQTPGLQLLPIRRSPVWEEDDHHHGEGVSDMHFWLNPKNASILVDYIAKVFSEQDPVNAALYEKNRQALKLELAALDLKLTAKLKNVKKIPYLVFHDGYQYFEHHYGLTSVGAITLHPELPISLERLNTLRQTIQKSKAHCIFSEPQFKPKLVERLVEETGIKTGVLDPEGKKTPQCAKGYFILLENLANSLNTCLSSSAQ